MKDLSTAERAIATDDDHSFEPELKDRAHRLPSPLGRAECLRARRPQERSTRVQDIAASAPSQRVNHLLAPNQPFIALGDAKDVHAMVQANTQDGTNCSIHPGGIPATGQHTDASHLTSSRRAARIM